jgi:ribosomal protein S18
MKIMSLNYNYIVNYYKNIDFYEYEDIIVMNKFIGAFKLKLYNVITKINMDYDDVIILKKYLFELEKININLRE